ncbi:MAG: serine hydrolase [Bacteroidetes bacterium]|nr:serine hydrolase [Bacteroidota bacterium]
MLFGFVALRRNDSPHLFTKHLPGPADDSGDDKFLESLMKKYPQYFDSILQKRDSFKVQIIYTQINRDASNNPSFKYFYFNVNADKYFYPASTVKLPVALLALQKLNELRRPGLTKNSSMITGKAYSGQTMVLNDPTTPDGRPNIAQYVKKIFLVSDNDAFNRLYEFLGQEYINERLHKMGYPDVRIVHRLQIPLTEDENRHTNPVGFYNAKNKLIYAQPMQFNQRPYVVSYDSVAKAYYSGEKFIDHAMDFSKKNKISLQDLTNILRSVLFPASVPAKQRFKLKEEDYNFVYQYMSQFPGETKYPAYDTANYWDAYGKFLYYGSEKGELPKSIRIFNKEGDAYGFLHDISYFVDFDKHIEFMLSASIYCNRDEIENDDKYDYDSLGLPFFKNLGRVIYDYETKRKRAHIPGLAKFRLKYDK